MHRWHRRIRGLALAGVSAALAVLLLSRLGVLPSARRLSFQCVVLIILCSNLFWWSWVRTAIDGRSGRTRNRRRAGLGLAWTLYVLLMLTPVLLLPLGLRHARDQLAVPILTWTLIWHLLMAIVGSVAVVLTFIRGGWNLIKARRAPAEPTGDAVPTMGASPEGDARAPLISRRGLLAAATAVAPIVMTAGASLSSMPQAGRFRVRRLTVSLPRLPEGLKGLTITHISDIHLGRLFRTEHLPRMVDEANKLKSHLVAVTGDIIDHSNDYLPAAVEALAQIEAPHGRYTVIGNHDLFGRAHETVKYLESHEPHFLNDELLRVQIGGDTLQIAGLFWSRNEDPAGFDPGLVGRAAKTLASADRDGFTLALAHHPHAFEALAERGADLVLAGHTHGGQLMLLPAENGWPLGAGNLMFRYLHGVYSFGGSRMYVNSGVGNWFPVRINAPAEIVQLRLV